jgi:hypothetical protein
MVHVPASVLVASKVLPSFSWTQRNWLSFRSKLTLRHHRPSVSPIRNPGQARRGNADAALRIGFRCRNNLSDS